MQSRFWKTPIKVSLQWVLVIPFVLQTTIVVGLASWLFLKNGEQAAADLAYQLSHKITLSVEEKFQALVNQPATVLQINQAAVDTNAIDLADFNHLETFFWRQLTQIDDLDSLYVGEHTGRFLLVKNGPTPSVHINDVDQQRRAYRLNANGQRTQLLSTVQYDPRQRPWYEAAAQKGMATWSPIYLFAAEPILGITSAIPVYGKADGQLQGVLAADLSLNKINDLLRSFTISSNSVVLVMERSGAMVASSLAEAPFVETAAGRERRYVENSQHPLIYETFRYLQGVYGGFDQITEDSHQLIDLEGERYFLDIKQLQDGYGLDWLMVIAIPEADFMAPLHTSIRSTVVLCLIALACSGVISTLIAQRISAPMARLVKASRAMAQGDLHQSISVQSISEVNVLAQSFNHMAQVLDTAFQTLGQTNQDLESRVDARTMALKQQIEREQILTQQLAAVNDELRFLANMDGLTQVANRRKFDEVLQGLWQASLASRQSLTVMLCDIDFFKRYNDTYGHPAGDACLKKIGQILSQTVSEAIGQDPNHRYLVARYGGEEFAILMANLPPEQAHQIALQCQKKLATTAITHRSSALPDQRVTMSIGLCHLFPEARLRPSVCVGAADQALYEAKKQGRDRIVLVTRRPILRTAVA